MKLIILNNTKLFTISVIVLFLASCSGGIQDRAGTIEGKAGTDLTNEEATELALDELDAELSYLQIEEKYADANKLFPSINFSNINHLHLVKCADSPLASVVNKYQAFGRILFQSQNQENIIGFLNLVLERMNNELKKGVSNQRARIIVEIINIIETKRAALIILADKCVNAKVKTIEEDDKEEQKEDPNEGTN